ncbi:uncharacterized protein LOC108863894 [Galendromus occidentalis]|uniref:Uncharacterized protein LOC108863894 n=1 Tax=Galendromus occidentalis TaxID=34638 RepID=A0AAJ7L2W4_9ACAR|nr:uncharacterized protein LOC108863894 [Galendromus occidentalis]
MGEDGLIHSESRLILSSRLTTSQIYPLILPSDCNLSKLIVQDIHERKCFHSGGVNAILHILRQDFLLIHARRIARQVIKTCPTCKIFHCEAANLPVPPLPAFRIEETPPFFHCGVDFAGPFRYKKDRKSERAILLFTCAVTRGVNLNLCTDLSTVEVLGALQKFISRFPNVRTITSDNGLSFQRAAKELKLLYESIKDGEVTRWLADSFISWKFFTACAPWFGAFYERQVQTMKRPLRKILGSAIPHFRDLDVIICNIGAMANRRPITTVASGTDEGEALSPSDLLYGYKGSAFIPEHSLKPKRRPDKVMVIFSRRWAYQQRLLLLNKFWKRYTTEYLQYLKTAHEQTPGRTKHLTSATSVS